MLVLVFIILFLSGRVIIYLNETSNNRKIKIEEEKKTAERLEKERLELLKKIEDAKIKIDEIYNIFKENLNGKKYISYKKYNKFLEQLKTYNHEIQILKENNISEYELLVKFYQDPSNFVKKRNLDYISNCKGNYSKLFLDIDKNKIGLTDKQMDAVFCEEDCTLVNAGAGTGKTKTIESKVLYLIKILGYKLEDLLVITFSKKSQEDMLIRIKETLKKADININDKDLKSNISTFHSYGKNIVDEEDSKLVSTNEIGKGGKHKKVLENDELSAIIDKAIKKTYEDPYLKNRLLDYILYFHPAQVTVEQFSNLNEYYQFNKKTFRTLIKDSNGYNVTVKSYGEFLIANFCIYNGIKVEYEPRGHHYTNESGRQLSYKPDFYLPDYDIYIEYFGVDDDLNTAPYINAEDYVMRMNKKIKAHKNSGNKLIDIRYGDLKASYEYFINKLSNQLKKNGVALNPSNQSNIVLEYIESEKLGISKTLMIFLALFKESNKSIDYLKGLSNKFDKLNSNRNEIFLLIFEVFFRNYQLGLAENLSMDFGDMIYESVKILESGTVKRNYQYILVDEFQDISEARAELIKQTIKFNQECKLFCVGDDWQSIYQFAGSNSNIFRNFDKYFGYTQHIILDKTFRFNQGISDISGAFIMENPSQSKKSLTSIDISKNNKVSIIQKDKEDEQCYQLLIDDIIEDSNKKNKNTIKIYYLTRNSLEKYKKEANPLNFLNYVAENYKKNEENIEKLLNLSEDEYYKYGNTYFKYDNKFILFESNKKIEINILTIHKSKGLEGDYVIMDFVNQGLKYNFPSSFEDDPILQLITNDTKEIYPFSEERRLFYVGLTRGSQKSYILYNQNNESLFIKNLIEVGKNIDGNIIRFILKDGQESSLKRNIETIKCKHCGGKMIKSNDSKVGEERYCSNFFHNCMFTIQIINGKVYESKKCPRCKGFMTIRKNNKNGTLFWGCKNYPECDYTSNIL